MPNVLWEPDNQKPKDASALETEMLGATPGAEIKLTFKDGEWLVRALAPAAMCARGGEFTDRDVSTKIIDILTDHDYPARAFPRR